MLADTNIPWMKDAACIGVDPAFFYPEQGQGATWGVQICGECPVRETCLTYALTEDERFGTWGGLTAENTRIRDRGGSPSRQCLACENARRRARRATLAAEAAL